MASKSNHLMPHPSIHIQHPQVFENLHTKISSTSTSHQQQWMLLPSEGTSNTTGSMGKSCRWSKSSSGIQFAPVLREVSHTVKVMYTPYVFKVIILESHWIRCRNLNQFSTLIIMNMKRWYCTQLPMTHKETDLKSWSTT